jgi:hypothetical protein
MPCDPTEQWYLLLRALTEQWNHMLCVQAEQWYLLLRAQTEQ